MDLLFWDDDSWNGVAEGDAFVSFHGSWNSQIPVGYRIDHVVFANGKPVSSRPFLGYSGPGAYQSQYVALPHPPFILRSC